MYLLDSNVLSDLRRRRRGSSNPGLVAWVDSVPTFLLFISVITLFELEQGVLQIERTDVTSGRVLRSWLEGSVIPAFAGRVLDVDAEVARTAAGFHVPDPAPFRDALIGATADVHDLTVVTRNERDFQRLHGVRVLNPWT